jgi:hypothetical protein
MALLREFVFVRLPGAADAASACVPFDRAAPFAVFEAAALVALKMDASTHFISQVAWQRADGSAGAQIHPDHMRAIVRNAQELQITVSARTAPAFGAPPPLQPRPLPPPAPPPPLLPPRPAAHAALDDGVAAATAAGAARAPFSAFTSVGGAPLLSPAAAAPREASSVSGAAAGARASSGGMGGGAAVVVSNPFREGSMKHACFHAVTRAGRALSVTELLTATQGLYDWSQVRAHGLRCAACRPARSTTPHGIRGQE